jgi:hypothetical protein
MGIENGIQVPQMPQVPKSPETERKEKGVDLAKAIDALQGLENINLDLNKLDKQFGGSLSELRRDTFIFKQEITDQLALRGEGQSPDFRSNFDLIAQGIAQIQELVRLFKQNTDRLEEEKNNVGIYLSV